MKFITYERKLITAFGRRIVGHCGDPISGSVFAFAVVFDTEDENATYDARII
jgi:hypothetical protein